MPSAAPAATFKEPIQPADDLGPWDDWPWSLLGIVPDAAEAAWRELRTLVVWHFHLAGR